jgi:hypothetical protein
MAATKLMEGSCWKDSVTTDEVTKVVLVERRTAAENLSKQENE